MTKFVVHLVGPFRVVRSDGSRVKFASRKSEAILAILLLSPHGFCMRSKLRNLLWSTRSHLQQRNSLGKELVGLKNALGRDPDAPIKSDRRIVELDLSRFDVQNPPDHGLCQNVLLDGLDVFDSPAFDAWLGELRGRASSDFDGGLDRNKKSQKLLATPGQGEVFDGTRRESAPVPKLRIEITPTVARVIHAPNFASEIAAHNVNRLADTLVRSLFQFDYWEVVDSRHTGRSAAPFRGTHSVSLSAYVSQRSLEFQIVLRDPNNTAIWVNPKFSCDISSQKVFSYFDDVCAILLEFLIGYAHGGKNNTKWQSDMQMSDVLDGLFIPGSRPISDVNLTIDRAIAIEPSAINISLRNCARMLQYGERMEGYDCVTKDLVRHDVRRALELSPNSSMANLVASHAFSLFLQDNGLAVEHAQRSVELQPDNKLNLAFLALALLRAGRSEEASRCMDRARTLPGSSLYESFMDAVFCACLTTCGDFQRARAFGERALKANPKFNATKKYLFASNAHLGRYKEAQALADDIATFDDAFGVSGLQSGTSPLNIKPAVSILARATSLVGIT
ncbi:hypothetical protein [uncultured Tateyamaria sp.]|uniref:hypothetical protein n=1 Tax=uncultured Tateyamaria sp. TaxID=455651 RepID=UPI002613E7A6|nr:hypothetical protein [uncultured Tateyamaria sp.]